MPTLSRVFGTAFALVAFAPVVRADAPVAVFAKRIEPIFKSPDPLGGARPPRQRGLQARHHPVPADKYRVIPDRVDA